MTTTIEALARMPEAPDTFTLAQYQAAAGVPFLVAKKRMLYARQAGLAVSVFRGVGGQPSIYQRTAVDLARHRAEMHARIVAGVKRNTFRTPVGNSVFNLA